MKWPKDFINKIICGDCLDVMKQMPDKCVDLVLTDPPYGKKCDKGTSGFGIAKNRKYKGGWDSKIPDTKYFKELFRISKNQIIFGGNYFNLPLSNCWIVWDKVGNYCFNNPFAQCELIWTSFTRTIKKYTLIQQGFIRDSKNAVYHPTQKPTEIICFILKDFSKRTDIILDCFLGSGTTAVACKELNRNFIGIEINQEYCDIANKRLINTQKSLFT